MATESNSGCQNHASLIPRDSVMGDPAECGRIVEKEASYTKSDEKAVWLFKESCAD